MLRYGRPVSELVRARSSQRTYAGEALSQGERRALEEGIAALSSGPFGSAVRVRLVEGASLDRHDLSRFGSYGFISGAPAYLAGVVGPGPRNLEDFGFVFEQLVLKATELGLGTCWLGGTLHRAAIGELLGGSAEEIVPAMTPVGRAAPTRGLVDRIVHLSAGSARRKPASELFFDGQGRPLDLRSCGWLAEALEAVRWAPSAANAQPWRVVWDGEEGAARGVARFYLARAHVVRTAIRAVDLPRLDLGIAMAHFALVAGELGIPWRTEPAPPDGTRGPGEPVATFAIG